MSGKKGPYTAEENSLLKAALRRERKRRDLTQGQMGELLGIEQQNVARAENNRGDGFNRTTANALARLMGFEHAETLLLAEMATPPPDPHLADWRQREAARQVAVQLGYPTSAIDAVLARYVEDRYRAHPTRWWLDKFYDEEIDQARDAAPASAVPATETAAPSRRPRARKVTGT